ncbi:hypothetical protein [Antarcticirhabdus aurantiaca]|uniref:Uncharacterized protein n=1 Tax=Antarcticirhabdus aurantiaca TaxID=2606717 RepID=A0ACD4NU96_9HYPH|nr:hypothetical protein [Antarcticirhabdus aurantiaca]WAJ30496.1 hypothetical protein OXU80_09955 [Jeongeuplla avenae]
MTGWRFDLAVFTDLSASLFAACFMILLIFLHLAQETDAARSPPRAIEARTAYRLIDRTPLAPAAMLDLLRRHRGDPGGVSIDLFADRIEILGPGGAAPAVVAPEAVGTLARERLGGIGSEARLYVLSPRLYDRTIAALTDAGLSAAEITVPRALGDGTLQPIAWRGAFADLEATSPTPEAFRAGVARILEGGDEEPIPARTQGGAPATGATAQSLSQRVATWIARLVAGAALIGGFGLVVVQERRRIGAARLAGSRVLASPATTI